VTQIWWYTTDGRDA